MAARNSILAAIRSANGGATTVPMAENAWSTIAREYEVSKPAPRAAVLELFEERLKDYDADVQHCAVADLTATVLATLQRLGITKVAVPNGLAGVDLPTMVRGGLELIAGDGATAAELDTAEAVLTGSTLGIAETGSLVLQNVPGQGARALSLVPDTHLCIVACASVVATVPEAIRALRDTHTLPTTFVSGPSATADIEMTRIKGVHGPRFLHVFLVD